MISKVKQCKFVLFLFASFLLLLFILYVFCNYLHYKKGMVLHLTKKLKTSSSNDALCQVWLKMAKWFWRRRVLKVHNVVMILYRYIFTEVRMKSQGFTHPKTMNFDINSLSKICLNGCRNFILVLIQN